MVPVPPTTGMLWHWLHDVPLNLGPSPSPAVSTERKSSRDRKSTRLNSSHGYISYAVFCLKKKKTPSDAPDPVPDQRRTEDHTSTPEATPASRHQRRTGPPGPRRVPTDPCTTRPRDTRMRP